VFVAPSLLFTCARKQQSVPTAVEVEMPLLKVDEAPLDVIDQPRRIPTVENALGDAPRSPHFPARILVDCGSWRAAPAGGHELSVLDDQTAYREKARLADTNGTRAVTAATVATHESRVPGRHPRILRTGAHSENFNNALPGQTANLPTLAGSSRAIAGVASVWVSDAGDYRTVTTHALPAAASEARRRASGAEAGRRPAN
jgi:hypothetical protein